MEADGPLRAAGRFDPFPLLTGFPFVPFVDFELPAGFDPLVGVALVGVGALSAAAARPAVVPAPLPEAGLAGRAAAVPFGLGKAFSVRSATDPFLVSTARPGMGAAGPATSPFRNRISCVRIRIALDMMK